MTTLSKQQASDPAAQRQSGDGTRLRYLRPYYEVDDRNENFEVRVFMPGVRKSGVDITYENDMLTVSGTRDRDLPEGWRPLHRERRSDSYHLELQLNVDVDGDRISAHVEDGVLTLTLPKAETIKPRRIPVE